jgi:soluble lytic murein transglycosylase-like protein
MHSTILRIEADVEARKRPRGENWATVRSVAFVTLAVLTAFELGAMSVDSSAGLTARARMQDRVFSLSANVDGLQGQIDFQKMQVERLQRAHHYSAKYRIPADLAMAIHEIALAENIDPQLAFELVRVESRFNAHAVSPVGALGYTQLMPSTARLLKPGITRAQIFDRDTNLRLGFRFLRSMVNHYDGDVRLALLAYNRGPATVDRLLRAGSDPGNGYAQAVLGKQVRW